MNFNRNILNKFLLLLGTDDGISVEWRSDGECGAGFYCSTMSGDEIYVEAKDDGAITFEDIIKPVMRWLDDNHHPHTSIYVDSRTAELLEGQKTYHNKVFND